MPSALAGKAAPRPLGFEYAQRWCNFVLFRPKNLPDDVQVETTLLRPEAPPGRQSQAKKGESRPEWSASNRSSYRVTLRRGADMVRIKQFLYDWAPPACDHPSLWGCRATAFPLGQSICWTGTDYRSRRAACVAMDRTTIELAVCEGSFSDTELRNILNQLEPAMPAAREDIIRTPLVELAYQRRHRERTIEVPTGYHRHRRRECWSSEACRSNEIPQFVLNAVHPRLRIPPYRLNGAFVFWEGPRLCEADFVYEDPRIRGRSLRLLVVANDCACYPPTHEKQVCTFRIESVNGHEVHYAYLDERYGPHEAVFQVDNFVWFLLAKPAPTTDTDWFRRVLARTVPQ